jgi:CHAT domain-containing protein/tetratricopeptide (TPR) repeat protein
LDAAFAWALKDACYAAWNTEPRRAAQAATLLAEGLRITPPSPARREIEALAAWTRGIAALTRGQMAEAVQAFDDAAQGFREIGQPCPAAQTQVPKIMALAMLGRHAEAVACAEQAQAAFIEQGDVHAASKVSLNLGSLHLRHDEFAPAAQHYRDAVRLFAKVGDREHSVMADIGLADALTALGDLDEAERIYARARVRAAAHELPVLQAMVDESVALLDLSRGRFGQALAGFERSRAGYERLAMPQHLAIAEKQLADAYLELRLLPEAEVLYVQVLQKFDALDMPDDKAWTLAQRGRARALRGDATAAASDFDAALVLFDAQDNPTGRAAVTLARAELALARRDSVAARLWADAARQAHANVDSADGAVRVALVHAQSLALAGNPRQAREAFEAALAQARQGRRLGAEVRAIVGLAAADRALGDDEAARAGFREAVQSFEALRQALPGDDVRSAFLADHLQPYRELLRYALHEHAQAPTTANAAQVIREAERMRARTLSERLAGGERSIDVDDGTAALRARVSWLSRRVHSLEDDADTPSATLLDELHASERQLLEQARRGRLVGTAGSAGIDALDVDALCATLADDDALVDYVTLDDEWLACVLRREGVTVHRGLATWSAVGQAAQAVRFQLDALSQGAAAMNAHLPTLAARCNTRLQQLHALIWAPLVDVLANARRVLLVAPAPLSSLPFAALNDGAQTLAERHELAWLPSAGRALNGFVRSRPRGPGNVLVMGESSRLPHAAAEARAIVREFDHATLRLDEQATVEALTNDAVGAELLHLACHAQFRADSPSFSALHLHDGALTAEQVETLPLQAQVVVLSGCETAGREPGDAAGGDEWVGLVRAFLLAGAGRVVASHWPVDDRITASFMSRFYRSLVSGRAPAAALREAQLHLRRQHPHPFHWSAFALFGGF